MAWDYYLNMEAISFDMAVSHVEQMTCSNYTGRFLDLEGNEKEPDSEAFLNNLRNGFAAVVMIGCFVESCLNTILREYRGFDPSSSEMHKGESDKLEIIFGEDRDSYIRIKGSHYWREYQRMKHVRNALVHYKNNCPGVMGSYPPFCCWEVGGELIAEFFTRESLESFVDSAWKLVGGITKALGLEINPRAIAFGADGRCGIGSYICTAEEAARERGVW